MDTFYIEPEKFWEWFDRAEDDNQLPYQSDSNQRNRSGQTRGATSVITAREAGEQYGPKRMKSDFKPRTIDETEAGRRSGKRYVIMYSRHKPGRKNKIWEGDGFLTMLGSIAHLCNTHGRLLEDPTHLDEVDLKEIEELGELLIGNTDVQVVELDE